MWRESFWLLKFRSQTFVSQQHQFTLVWRPTIFNWDCKIVCDLDALGSALFYFVVHDVSAGRTKMCKIWPVEPYKHRQCKPRRCFPARHWIRISPGPYWYHTVSLYRLDRARCRLCSDSRSSGVFGIFWVTSSGVKWCRCYTLMFFSFLYVDVFSPTDFNRRSPWRCVKLSGEGAPWWTYWYGEKDVIKHRKTQ